MDRDAERRSLARKLTVAFLDAPWSMDLLAESGAASIGHWPDWMTALTMRVVAVHRTRPLGGGAQLLALVVEFLDEHRVVPAEAALSASPPPPLAARPPRWGVTEIPSVVQLAQQLELSDGQLAWLADVRSLERTVTSERLRNYRYRALPREGGMPRVIEAPKARLKEIQRWILREVLDRVPPHDAAHGFTHGRSAVTHAERHTGRVAVLRLDLKDFFASVPAGRVYRIWRAIGYSPAVSHVLTGLTTNTVPLTVWERIESATSRHSVQARFQFGRRLATPHLPQGAPTSPALANLAALSLDRRLAGLARATGITYTRYADDLTFSGPARLIRRRAQFEQEAAAIARAEGFALNEAKSTMQSAGGRQTVCGVVVNVRPNLRRSDYDRLKATLHNAVVAGPAAQNRDGVADFEAHLRGRISWVESLNPARAGKLLDLFAQIDWS